MVSDNVARDPLIKKLVQNSLDIWNTPIDQKSDKGTEIIVGKYKNYVRRKWVFIFVCIAATFLALIMP